MVGDTIYVDVNIFIYWLGGHPEFGEAAYRWIKKIEGSPSGKFATSSLTLYETLVIIAGLVGGSLKDAVLTEMVVDSLSKIQGLKLEPLKSEDFVRALDLMKEYKLDYEDSLHLATALRIGAKEIISNDRDYDVTPLKRVM